MNAATSTARRWRVQRNACLACEGAGTCTDGPHCMRCAGTGVEPVTLPRIPTMCVLAPSLADTRDAVSVRRFRHVAQWRLDEAGISQVDIRGMEDLPDGATHLLVLPRWRDCESARAAVREAYARDLAVHYTLATVLA